MTGGAEERSGKRQQTATSPATAGPWGRGADKRPHGFSPDAIADPAWIAISFAPPIDVKIAST